MENFRGTPIEPNEAWQIFDRWRFTGQEIRVIFWGRSGNMYTLGAVEAAKKGRLHLKSETARASFNLVGATFRYGPMQTWPRWPGPPIVEVTAVSAVLPGGDYLALAEELRPESISGVLLPE